MVVDPLVCKKQKPIRLIQIFCMADDVHSLSLGHNGIVYGSVVLQQFIFSHNIKVSGCHCRPNGQSCYFCLSEAI